MVYVYGYQSRFAIYANLVSNNIRLPAPKYFAEEPHNLPG